MNEAMHRAWLWWLDSVAPPKWCVVEDLNAGGLLIVTRHRRYADALRALILLPFGGVYHVMLEEEVEAHNAGPLPMTLLNDGNH